MSIIQEGARHVGVAFEICGDGVVVAQAENLGHSMSIYQIFGPYCGAPASSLFELTTSRRPVDDYSHKHAESAPAVRQHPGAGRDL